MYQFVSLDKIIAFFANYSIDITVFSSEWLSLIVILSNIFVVLFYFFMIYCLLKLIYKVISWWF